MMPIVIDELLAEVQPEVLSTPGAAAEPRPAAGQPGETLLDLLALNREREARLAID